MLKNCSTCGKQTKKYSEFGCTSCGAMIARCDHCRLVSNPYKCPKCGVDGP
jgi:Zn-ribbon RNA-binding protein